MVKVQKPKPKTLTTVGGIKPTIVKKKKNDSIQKPIKSDAELKKKSKGKEVTVALPEKEKPIKSNAVNSNLKDSLPNDKHVEEGKKTKNSSQKGPLVPPMQKPIQPKEKKQKKVKQEEIAKKPLILAPPKSPKSAEDLKPKKQKETVNKSHQSSGENLKARSRKNNDSKQNKLQQNKSAKRSANHKKNILKAKKGKKSKSVEAKIVPLPFDEDKFKAIVCLENIMKIAKALKSEVETEVNKKKTSIFSDYRYMLNISYFKIPNCPKRMVKLNLKHSLVDKNDDILIVVPDLKRGGKVDWEPTIQHYEDLFREAGVQGHKLTVMPFNQMRNEYNSFETVRKLGSTYDYFLADGRLIGQLAGFTGKVFQTPRRTFHSVRLQNKDNIKNEIAKSLRRTAYRQMAKGDLISIPVGNDKFSDKQLSENVAFVVEQLKTVFAGGLPNVRGIYLKMDIVGTSSLPIFLSTNQPPVATPNVIGPREERMHKLKREANAVLEKFAITKDADVIPLSQKQIQRKQKFKEAQAALLADTPVKNDLSRTLVDDDGEESTVPAKKARKDEKSDVEKDIKKKKETEEEETEEECEASGDEDEDDSESGDGEEDDDEDDDDVEDDDDDGDDDEDDDEDSDGEGDDDDEDEDDE